MSKKQHWIFGYGSLIYKVDFPYLDRDLASLRGWSRRFWQGSVDHRGTPESPGRVVTLVPDAEALCRGVAFLVDESVFAHLDHREKNGYERHRTELYLEQRKETVTGTFYIAAADNPAFLGDAPDRELAKHIAASHGPSGSNADYLLSLASALREIGEHDEHVVSLEQHLIALGQNP
ncbi:gamma-glutamylcyclotransferase [Congregibacter variabilis]|uniref:glutathione-specific gamma-glutamylcyclotransferase n=1 Tax=Congregibacter variabilis TaxID=3081200 RepID=A0ABZ0I955_9GAMM|nr:gamma-glutamylcyclotransferase [Congregibacter sp. IMCC43200]